MIAAKLVAALLGSLAVLARCILDRGAAGTYIGGGGAHIIEPQAILEHAQQRVRLDLVGEGQRLGLIVPIMRQRQRCFGVSF